MHTDFYSRSQKRNKPVGLDLENANNKILNSIIKKWPSQLKEQFYSDWNSTEVSLCYINELQELLNDYLEMDNLSMFFPVIEEILMVIKKMIIFEPDSSNTEEYDSGFLKFASEHAKLKYIPECAELPYVPECAKLPYVPECAKLPYFPECAKNPYTSESSKIPASKRNKSSSCNNMLLFFFGFVGIIIGVYALWEENELNKIVEWEKNIIEMKKKFPSQNEKMWISIQAGVKTTVTEKPIQPSVFLLTYNDKKTSTCLAHLVGKEVTKLLSESAQEPIIIKGEDLKRNKSLSQDYGLFTETYKHDIEEKHVMIVLDLQEIPPALAQSFHILCDLENPLIPNAAFLFTLQIHDDEKNPTAVAEKHLKLLWKDSLDVDIMDPLITRVTNAVFSVKLETDLPC